MRALRRINPARKLRLTKVRLHGPFAFVVFIGVLTLVLIHALWTGRFRLPGFEEVARSEDPWRYVLAVVGLLCAIAVLALMLVTHMTGGPRV